MSDGAVKIWDFTLNCEYCQKDTLIELLEKHCERWTFQQEQGDKNGYVHWQGRVCLKIATRLTGIVKLGFPVQTHWSRTSNPSKGNVFYVVKEDTRIDGPWTDKDEKIIIPEDLAEIKEWKPWQQAVRDLITRNDKRNVHVIIDKKGNHGKTTLALWMHAYGEALRMPPVNSLEKIMQVAYDMKDYPCYVIDLPRAMNKNKLDELFQGIEELKNGYVYDLRYEAKIRLMKKKPAVIVFSNKVPDKTYLSKDRWKFWWVDDDEELYRGVPPDEEEEEEIGSSRKVKRGEK